MLQHSNALPLVTVHQLTTELGERKGSSKFVRLCECGGALRDERHGADPRRADRSAQ